jgi:YVTN family beta-propeller protein
VEKYMKKIVYTALLSIVAIVLSGCGPTDNKNEQSTNTKLYAYFSDNVNNAVNVIDVDKMELLESVQTGYQDTHTAGIALQDAKGAKLYVANRKSRYLNVFDTHTNAITQTIPLAFCPRSISVQKETHLVNVAATDKPMAAIIDAQNDELIATVGSDVNISDKCGHSFWLDKSHFVFIDREHTKLYNYEIKKVSGTWQTTEIDALDTPSPVHHIAASLDNPNLFYAMAEGNSTVYPEVLKLTYSVDKHLDINETLDLKYGNLTLAEEMHGHHLNLIPESTKIYAGSKEGHLFVIDYSTVPMQITKILDAGKGAGHTAVSPDGKKAVVINHNDKFITLIDTATDTKIADIIVSELDDSNVGQVQIQAHTQYHFSDDGRYFYMALTEEGELIKVDLKLQEPIKRVHVLSGKLTMGSFIKVSE